MIEKYGDIWANQGDDYICVTTNAEVKPNGRLIMGGGIALEALKKFPSIDLELGQHVKTKGNVCCLFPAYKVISFPTKNKVWGDSILNLISLSLADLKLLVEKNNIKAVRIPRPGCGLGGLKWQSQVKPLMDSYNLDERFQVWHFKKE